MTNIDLVGTAFSSNKPYLFRAIYEWILDNEGTPYLLVDAMQPNVQVPQEHVKDGQIILNVSPGAIQGWFSDNEAISFSARFSGKAQQIYIPMNSLLAIYAQENSLGMAFPEDVDQSDSDRDESNQNARNPSIESKGGLKEVTPEPKSDSNKPAKSNKDKKSTKKSHLKVIK